MTAVSPANCNIEWRNPVTRRQQNDHESRQPPEDPDPEEVLHQLKLSDLGLQLVRIEPSPRRPQVQNPRPHAEDQHKTPKNTPGGRAGSCR